jgi:hypothetical protein
VADTSSEIATILSLEASSSSNVAAADAVANINWRFVIDKQALNHGFFLSSKSGQTIAQFKISQLF